VDYRPMVCTHYHEACDLSKTQFKHLDGTAVITEEYERMHRFIRLWCKLGWEIEEVDQAITGVGEAASHPLPAPSGFFTSAPELHLIPSIDPEPIDDFIPVPIDLSDCQPEPASQVAQEITPYLIEQLVAIKKVLTVTGLKLPGLLTFWTTIGVYGEKSLYQRLFLKYNQKALNNPFLEDEFGVYLSKEGELISTHLPFLMAAFKTDADTLEGVMNLAGIANEMTLENVSAIYRYLQLMKTLGLKLVELRGLIDLTAPLANPFGKPTETQSFYSLFERIENSGFDLRTLNYSILDQDDPRRPLNPGVAHTFRLAMTLREALLKIETDHPDITQVDETTETLLRDKLSLILDSETVENILTLLYGTTTYSDNTRMQFSKNLSPASNEELTEYLQVANNLEVDDPQKPAMSFLNRVSFSPANGLRVTGILNDADQESLTALAGAITHAEDRTNFEVVIEKIQAQPEQLATDLLSEIFTHDPSVKEAILIADAAGDHTEENTAPQKLLAFGVVFLPYLRDQLRKRTVFQTLSGDLGLDTNLTQFLVMDVILSASGDAIYEEIIRLKEQEDAITDEEPEITRKEGFFVPEQDGTYVFLLEATGEATLMLDNQQLWDTHQHTDAEGINYYSSPSLFLTAGKAYPYQLEGYNTDSMGECIGFYLKFENQASVELAPNMLFPKQHTEAFHEAYIRLHQASLVVQGFDVTLPELKFFREHAGSLDDLDFNALTFTHWLQLEAFYRLKNSLPETTLSLVNFLRWSHQAEVDTEPSLTDQLHALTGWERPAIENLLLPAHLHLDDPEHFRDATNLLTLQHALQVAEKVGVGIGYLFAWGAATSDFDRNRAIAGGIREAIRARYTQEDWETGIKPVHDRLRGNQRDALVAYLLAQPVLRAWGVRDANGLFEFLLIDVEMEPCMETSRIKQAISSVQLYVQRCFLGLEADHGVQSEDLDLERWEWMSRYRVWEANRKVFLYPENWIEPQLRDNKSPFFEELESELLQNDINQDLVKAALTKYMVKVDEVANLEVLGQYLEGDTTSGKLHVVGRTRNAPFFFYYRWYDYATSYWYPWEKVEVDVPSIDVKGEDGRTINNGSYAIPVIWNDRLFIFFPEMMEKNWTSALQKHQTITESAENKSEDIQPLNYWEIKLGWTERKEGKWTPKQLSNRTVETIVVANAETYHIYSEVDKFIFAPFVDDDGVYIRPYYVGVTLEVEETLGKGQVLTREITPDTDPTTLIHSFKFESDKVRVTSTIAYGLVPAHWSNTYAFHTSAGSLEPIQGEGIENYPVSMVEPSFSDLGGQVTFKSGSADYNFHHPTTRKLLGYLRKDRMEQVIKELGENSDDNYGSNGGTSYHELARPFALYNWEFQFHAIATLADQLAKSQRFEESMQWWHYIFNPIAVQGDIRYAWRFFPFWAADSQNVLDQLFDSLDPNAPDQEVTEWRESPFMPHVIARSRPTSYMKWVVMKYIDNLIAWGDHLFRQDSIESINQATQVYVLASHILGPKPEIIPKRGKVQPKSYLDLVDQWDAFSNAMVDLELLFPFSNQINTEGVLNDEGEPHYVNIYGFATTLYFCIPDNPKLLGYWDTVADRLFKIRHCLNIEGVFRKLSLFQPPIDPALLVKAAAQGLSIGSVLSDLSTPLPN
ncbi:MAG: neuraminidase-like domain-containing protein, partial [Bacteroidota bacterium]